ncbi:phosphodiester glycosidase family protein [Rufibacter roseus]|uniref:Phosphodiester glycosidase family protein n=1 Tax=Rufibacter roseus TaxID=1567108 RepID=A0ABW2DHG1_9BACT|nr:phosphodiester glycosidase family protein [Rufibacter roseus]
MNKTLLNFKKLVGVSALMLLVQAGYAQMTWTKPANLNTGLPASVEVFTSTTPIVEGVPTKAYYTIADLTDQQLELKVAYDSDVKTPSQFLAAETREPAYVALNAGFFAGAAPLSLVVQNGAIIAPNIRNFNREYSGTPTPYYPTRSAFGILPNNELDVAWIYNVGPGNIMYSYPSPSPNIEGEEPQAQPTATFPSGGTLWNPVTAVGGAPVLVQNGVKQITDAHELIKVDNTSRRARTAIGYTADKKVIMLVVEGGNAGESEGVTLSELADIMVSLGAVEAMNLDGGGSSAMVVKGTGTIRPSDAEGRERAMPTAIILKQRAPEPIIFDTEMTDKYFERGGNWRNTGNAGYYGASPARIVEVGGTGSKVAKFIFSGIEPGQYEVSTWTVAASNRSKDTPFTFYHNGVAQPVIRVDQSDAAINSKFKLLGTFNLTANDSLVITDAATMASTTTFITADAIKLQKVGTLSSSKADVLARSVNVYPVPTSGLLTVNVPDALRKQGSVYVVNLIGATVVKKQNIASNSVGLDLGSVPAGIYLVVLESPEGKVVKRVVKN